jgi:hypothetical protein
MSRDKDIEILDPAPFRDRLESHLRKLGATSEKRAIKLGVVGLWPFRCKAKLTATILSDKRFIVTNLGSVVDSCVHVQAQLSPHSTAAAGNSSFAISSALRTDTCGPLTSIAMDGCPATLSATSAPEIREVGEFLSALGNDDESSSEDANDSAKRPLKASDKRRKIRRVIY